MARAAVVQFQASRDKADNLERILGLVSRAASAGADLVAFPEFMMLHSPASEPRSALAAEAETMAGPFVRAIARAARECSVEVVGTLYERGGSGGRVYDTAFLADRSGRIASKYRKTHLYDALGFRESARMAPGAGLARPAGSRLGRLGMLVCYDLRFPEATRALASSGSEVIAAPSAWVRGPSKEDHWLTLNKARAIENGCYVVAPDHVGNGYCGRSVVVDPYGRILLDMGKRRGIGYADVSPGVVRDTRRALPLLRSRRTDVYPSLSV